jgi:hypothetical protein
MKVAGSVIGGILALVGIWRLIRIGEAQSQLGWFAEFPAVREKITEMYAWGGLLLGVGVLFLILANVVKWDKSEAEHSEVEKTTKKCPKCAEEVKFDAQICRFCKYDFLSPEEMKRQEGERIAKEAELLRNKTAKTKAEEFTEKGNESEKAGRYIEALDFFQEAEKIEPSSPLIKNLIMYVQPMAKKEAKKQERLQMQRINEVSEKRRVEGKAGERRERESQIRGKSAPKFNNQEEYETWKAERLRVKLESKIQ